MNNDLISREALRKAFHERIYYFNKSSWDEANALIDSAETVEYPFYAEAYQTGYEEAYKERPIRCKDCKYQVKEWREDKRMKEKGFWVYGCKHFGEMMGYWGFGGNDNEFCSDAEQKCGAKMDKKEAENE